MLTPCEAVVKYFLPAIKAAAAKELLNRHSLTQAEVATRLGLTQAAVSKYASGKYSAAVKKLEKDARLQRTARELAASIAKKESRAVTKATCAACLNFHNSACVIAANDFILDRIKALA